MAQRYCLLLVCSLVFPQLCIAEDAHHKHHAAVILGVTEKDGKTAGTAGIEYTYRLSNRFALGGWYEKSNGDFDLEAGGVIGKLFVTDKLPLMLGIGTERALFEDAKYLVRLGAEYRFHLGRVIIAPSGWVDLVEDGHQLFFIGASIGVGF